MVKDKYIFITGVGRMKFYITTDTHLGHKGIEVFCGRPKNFEQKILSRHKNTIGKLDTLIHLGDVSMQFKNNYSEFNNKYWHAEFLSIPHKRAILVRGNHDKHSVNWYYEQGWDCVCDEMTLKIYGKILCFSHKPVVDSGFDLNIHGHFHNLPLGKVALYEMELLKRVIHSKKHLLLSLEKMNYTPINLQKLVHKHATKIL